MRHGFVKMLICILTLFFCAEPLSVLGLEYENKDLFETDELQGTGYDINPEYADILSEKDLPEVHIPDSAQATITSANTFDKYGDVVNYLRKCMVNRQTDISFAYKNKYDDKSFILSAVQQAYTEYTGKPKESDYLLVNYKTSNWSWSRSVQNGLYVFTVNLTASYRTTSSQESQVDSAVKNLLNSLNVYNEDDYEKIWSVYEWVTSNITYDYTNYSDTARNDQKYTPYAGLILRTCVCQGYGGLVYRLLSELGVGVRYMRGYATDADGNYVTTGENNHGWNIVKLDGKYYHLDATWDASSPATDYYHYFLKSDADMENHVRRDTYNTSEFNSQFPVSSTSYEIPFEVLDIPHDFYLLEGESFTLRAHHRGDRIIHFWMSALPDSRYEYMTNSDGTYCTQNEITQTATSSMNGMQYLASFQKNGKTIMNSPAAYVFVGKTYRLQKWAWYGGNDFRAVFVDRSGNTQTVTCTVTSENWLSNVFIYHISAKAPDGVQYFRTKIEDNNSCLRSIRNSINGVEIQVNMLENVDRVNIYRTLPGVDDTETFIGTTTGTFIDKNVERGTQYRYILRQVFDEYLTEAYSANFERLTHYPFEDSTPALGNTTYKAVYWAYDNGIVKGLNDYEYGPNQSCTRAQLCVMLWRLKGKPSVNTGNNPFSDVSTSLGNTTYKAILWAYQQGIVKGSDGRFDPNGTTTRANMAVMLWRLAGKPAVNTSNNPFVDVSTDLGNTTYKAILWAYSVGLTKGTDDTHFSPYDNCTRAQLAVFLYRINNLYHYVK